MISNHFNRDADGKSILFFMCFCVGYTLTQALTHTVVPEAAVTSYLVGCKHLAEFPIQHCSFLGGDCLPLKYFETPDTEDQPRFHRSSMKEEDFRSDSPVFGLSLSL